MQKIKKNNNIIGILWMFGFIINITIMALCIRELSHKYGSFEKGYIGLQDHDSPLWFRNIKIRKL